MFAPYFISRRAEAAAVRAMAERDDGDRVSPMRADSGSPPAARDPGSPQTCPGLGDRGPAGGEGR
jgi:hypothetical protein